MLCYDATAVRFPCFSAVLLTGCSGALIDATVTNASRVKQVCAEYSANHCVRAVVTTDLASESAAPR